MGRSFQIATIGFRGVSLTVIFGVLPTEIPTAVASFCTDGKLTYKPGRHQEILQKVTKTINVTIELQTQKYSTVSRETLLLVGIK